MSNSSISETNKVSNNNDNNFEETNSIAFNNFLNEIKDYQNATSQLYTILNKF
ncbi:13371_t:CDS:1, partial [Cetraspora pellucida]